MISKSSVVCLKCWFLVLRMGRGKAFTLVLSEMLLLCHRINFLLVKDLRLFLCVVHLRLNFASRLAISTFQNTSEANLPTSNTSFTTSNLFQQQALLFCHLSVIFLRKPAALNFLNRSLYIFHNQLDKLLATSLSRRPLLNHRLILLSPLLTRELLSTFARKCSERMNRETENVRSLSQNKPKSVRKTNVSLDRLRSYFQLLSSTYHWHLRRRCTFRQNARFFKFKVENWSRRSLI